MKKKLMIVGALACLVTSVASAETFTFTNGSGDKAWSNQFNWVEPIPEPFAARRG